MEVQEVKEQLKAIFRTVINNDKWITIHPNGEDGKGRHLLLKDGESPKEAIERTYGKGEKSETQKGKEEKKSTFKPVKGIMQSLKDDYEAGKINAKEVAKELSKANLTPYLLDDNEALEKIGVKQSDTKEERIEARRKHQEVVKKHNQAYKDFEDGKISMEELDKVDKELEKSNKEFYGQSDTKDDLVDNPDKRAMSFEEYKRRGDIDEKRYRDSVKGLINPDGSLKVTKSDSKGDKKYNYTLTKREVEDRKMLGGMADTGNYYTNGEFAIDKKYLNIKGQEPTKKEEIEKSLKHILKGDSTNRYTPVKDFEIGELKREYGKPIKVAKYSYYDEKNGFERHIYLNKKYNDLFKNFDLKFGGETEPVFAYKGKDIVGVVMPINAREQSYSKTVNNEIEEELTKDKNQLKLKIDNSKEQDMALLEELKKLITKVENTKGEKDMEIENEKVDKRKLIDEVGGILKGKVDDEIIRTIIGKLEKVAYDKSEAGTADNEKEDAESCKIKNKDDEKEVKEVEEEVKEDVENKCKNSVENAKVDYFAKLNEIYNATSQVKKEASYVSRADREKAAEDYFAK